MTRRAPLLHALSWICMMVGLVCCLIPGGFLILVSAWLDDAAVDKEQALHDLDLYPSETR